MTKYQKHKIGIKYKGGSVLSQLIDLKQMEKNLCSSQKYHRMDYFLTFTCNQKGHFRIKKIREWPNDLKWQQSYPKFDPLFDHGKKEIKDTVEQAYIILILLNWMEVRKLFLNYLLHGSSSPLKSVGDLFARDEFQSDKGNLPHIHAVCSNEWNKLTSEQCIELEDIVRAYI